MATNERKSAQQRLADQRAANAAARDAAARRKKLTVAVIPGLPAAELIAPAMPASVLFELLT